jgi:ABC-type multidrug transport system permease subunit
VSASRPAIEAAGLGRDYGATCALHSLELAVARGVLFPLPFVSRAPYPTGGMPLWLRSVARVNPVTCQVDLMRVALGLPGELGVARSLLTLVVTSLMVFNLAAWLFDPEHRFVRREVAG